MSAFQGRDVLSIRDLSRADIQLVLRTARKMVPIAVGEKRSRALEGKNVVLVGDLKYGRTVHSLAYALAELGSHLTFVSPPTLEMPTEILEHVKERGLSFRIAHGLEEVVRDADVLYVTRIQKERFP